MLLLMESPFVVGDSNHCWLNVEATYIEKTNAYIFPNRLMSFAASVVIDCNRQKIVNINKTARIPVNGISMSVIEKLLEGSTTFDSSDPNWTYRLQQERSLDDKKKSVAFADFCNMIRSPGLPSTGLKGNIQQSEENSDDDYCETC